MGSAFDSFAESPLGGFIESPLGERSPGGENIYQYDRATTSIYKSATPASARQEVLNNADLGGSFRSEQFLKIDNDTHWIGQRDRAHKTTDRWASKTSQLDPNGAGGSFARIRGVAAGNWFALSQLSAAPVRDSTDGLTFSDGYTPLGDPDLEEYEQIVNRANGQLVVLGIQQDGVGQWRYVRALAASNAAQTWVRTLVLDDATFLDPGVGDNPVVSGYEDENLAGDVYVWITADSGSNKKVMRSSDLSTWADLGAFSGLDIATNTPREVIKTTDGNYLCYQKANGRNVKIFKSADLLTWSLKFTAAFFLESFLIDAAGNAWALGSATYKSVDNGENWTLETSVLDMERAIDLSA